MSDRNYLMSLVKEASVYRSQGLLPESRDKYAQVLEFVGRSEEFSNQPRIVKAVKEKIREVERDLAEAARQNASPELSQEHQGLIKELFTFSSTRETAAVEGAAALAQFGQYEQAVEEFRRLMREGTLPIVAAKNIIRCYIALSLPGAAIAEYRDWISSSLLTQQELKYIQGFLSYSLRKHGIHIRVPDPEEGFPDLNAYSEKKEEFLEISTISIQLKQGPLKGHALDLDVSSQTGSVVSVILAPDPKDLLDTFRLGRRFPDIQFYSPITVFRGTGVVSRKSRIQEGPRTGHYLVDITIEGD
jgi:tetratricopeptide (TPR) repeat protein